MELPTRADSARVARRFVRDTVVRWGLRVQLDIALLLVSELATNAVLHAGNGLAVELAVDGNRLRVSVNDGEGGDLAMRAGRRAGETGRGLLLVERLADGWGVERIPGGKAVWFDLRLSA
jgi:anti-sigma regulatory factor (Ser/Thr protein kinase)